MHITDATVIFEALSSAVRLETFRLLVRHEPTGLVAGELATALGVTPANLSFHLKTLAHAGLVTATTEGRFQRYRARLPAVQALVEFLTAECCMGDPARCASEVPQLACASRKTTRS